MLRRKAYTNITAEKLVHVFLNLVRLDSDGI